ncbi:MAG: hypothetical protein ABI346_06620 [Candidatus Baltobacteraceae bacterium]
MRTSGLLVITAGALVALAAWPAFVAHRVAQVRAADVPTPAPIVRDYENRDKLVAFWEGAVREDHRNDMLSPRILAGQYLQRYRERGDISDVLRAQHMAERSLAIQPRNIAATAVLASVMLTLHRFREALHYVNVDVAYDPRGPEFLTQQASLEMELGDYAGAQRSLGRVDPAQRNDIAVETIRSRYDELTGHLDEARVLLRRATDEFETNFSAPAAARAWYHFRAGELAFEAGDNDAAVGEERTAIAEFPGFNLAWKDLARFQLALHRYPEALKAATTGANITPFPETLGYEADAQAALGDAKGAAQTRDLIFAIERIGNAYHVNDRLLAVYYSDHHLRPNDTLAIAKREVSGGERGDEIYAQDTLAWAAAMDGQWTLAQGAMAKALRYGTQDPLLQFHAGAIALHFGRRAEAKRRFEQALRQNPNFHPVYADQARRALATL